MRAGTLKTEIRLPDWTDPVAGQLTFLDNAVQNATGTINLRATVSNSEHRLWPGRFVNIRLVLNTIHGAVLVPTTVLAQQHFDTFTRRMAAGTSFRWTKTSRSTNCLKARSP
jgi:multidrug efflux pump subunit AcrA (membrane-fusion protein)